MDTLHVLSYNSLISEKYDTLQERFNASFPKPTLVTAQVYDRISKAYASVKTDADKKELLKIILGMKSGLTKGIDKTRALAILSTLGAIGGYFSGRDGEHESYIGNGKTSISTTYNGTSKDFGKGALVGIATGLIGYGIRLIKKKLDGKKREEIFIFLGNAQQVVSNMKPGSQKPFNSFFTKSVNEATIATNNLLKLYTKVLPESIPYDIKEVLIEESYDTFKTFCDSGVNLVGFVGESFLSDNTNIINTTLNNVEKYLLNESDVIGGSKLSVAKIFNENFSIVNVDASDIGHTAGKLILADLLEGFNMADIMLETIKSEKVKKAGLISGAVLSTMYMLYKMGAFNKLKNLIHDKTGLDVSGLDKIGLFKKLKHIKSQTYTTGGGHSIHDVGYRNMMSS